ncbi:TRAP transporter large permease [Halomonas sp. McH1-25]|uniref:TRAP transporter large permease n=1 Tax=unclassified Halomonas TaxID=2609666 RepID=UPI001EF51E5F|nr:MULTISPECIES: TRAP transporter large permease [unclassified Halomonas]MCG7599820.1 TRAP transporter large permease [Halomonas sp. McH1-25]MCP1341715.1 TRAP transporter large permease [Halomonas sp. FL8]MCP1359873.1 TRAP transporter large permease [Halomonas sp. BBD45]MCP1364301.1 TRAP transporter large permease [Halomonas sp. BBD48]
MEVFVIMFVGLIGLLMLGLPVALAMIASSALVLGYTRGFDAIPLEMIAQRTLYGVNSFTLLAIPAFLLIGRLMNAAGISDRVFDIARCTVGHLKGGLGHVNVLASMLFAGMSGSAVADAGGLGAVEIKAMQDDGFPTDFSAAVTASSATIGPIIPPSIPAVIYGALANASIAAIFLGSILPGLFMGLGLMLMVAVISHRRGYPTRARATLQEFLRALSRGSLPMLTPLIIIVGILSGLFTPTEASVVALLYCLIISFGVYRSINLREFFDILRATAIDTAALLLIIAGSALYSWVLARYQVTALVADFLLATVTDPLMLLLLLSLFILLIGLFVDSVPALFLLTPLLVPVVVQYGIDPVHFGVLMIFNLMIGLITPPVGTVLFTIQKITNLPLTDLIRATLPFYIPLLAVLILITCFPSIVMFLPDLVLR